MNETKSKKNQLEGHWNWQGELREQWVAKNVPEGRGLFTPIPYQDGNFLLKPEEGGEEQTEGGIFIEQGAAPVGVVVEPEVVAGRRVLYRQYSGVETKINDEKFVIIPQDNILMWLADDDDVDPHV